MTDIKVTDMFKKVIDKFKYLNFNIDKTPINASYVVQKYEDKINSILCSSVEKYDISHELYLIRYDISHQ